LVAADGGAQIDVGSALKAAPVHARVSLFGEFALIGPQGIPITLANRRARALLAVLSVEPDRPIAREQVTKLLWSGRFEAQAKASLRQCLLELGKALEPLGQPILSVTREHIGLRSQTIRSDLGDLEGLLTNGCYEAAIAALLDIGTKPLLDQLNFGESFSVWLGACRGAISKRLKASIMLAVDQLDKAGDQRLRSRLLDAWEIREPSALRTGVADLITGKIRIAVLPFQAVGSQERADYFADGMVDELITTLGQVPQLLVAGRTSSFHFRDSDLSPASIADALRVSHLIEGSIQRQGDRVRIHVHLISGETGFELWGQRFDGSLDDVFALQENVAQAVTAAIGNALDIEIQQPLVRGMTHSKSAYDLYLQGRSLCAKLFGDGVLGNAIHLFEQALAIDPEFAECWVALAEAHQLVAVYTQCMDRNAASMSMAACAGRAIALSPALGYPYALLGVHQWTQYDIVGALDYAFEAYHREPGNPAVAMRLGSFLIYCGRTTEALPYVTAAIDQDPADGRKYALLWAIHFGRGELEAAEEVSQRIIDLGMPSIYLAMTSAALGKHDLAIEQYQQTKRLVNTIVLPPAGSSTMTPEAMDAYWLVAAKGVCSGKEADRQIYFQVLEMMYATLHDKSDLAITGPAVFTGNADLVFKTLGQHISPANTLALLPLWTDIDPIRQIFRHPDFIPFAERIGMTAAWEKYGWPDLLHPAQPATSLDAGLTPIDGGAVDA
jgi:TolB-like protein